MSTTTLRAATGRPRAGSDSTTGRQPRVVVISGGPGAEHDVSLRSGQAIATALRARACDVTSCVVSRSGTWATDGEPGLAAALRALAAADVAVPALHGPWGEDGGVQGFLETVGVPYTGSGVLASATCMDKARTKQVLVAAGIPVAPGRVVWGPIDGGTAERLARDFGLPLFVKPLRGGSSYGVTRVTDVAQVTAAVAHALRYDDAVLVEPELRGCEIDVGVLEPADGPPVASPPMEILADPDEAYFTTLAKYASDRTRFVVPAPLAPALASTLGDLACRAFDALGCAGLARVDFIVDGVLGPTVNEVNTFPGFTERSQFPAMWRAAGVEFPDLVRSLVDTALARARTPSPG